MSATYQGTISCDNHGRLPSQHIVHNPPRNVSLSYSYQLICISLERNDSLKWPIFDCEFTLHEMGVYCENVRIALVHCTQFEIFYVSIVKREFLFKINSVLKFAHFIHEMFIGWKMTDNQHLRIQAILIFGSISWRHIYLL